MAWPEAMDRITLDTQLLGLRNVPDPENEAEVGLRRRRRTICCWTSANIIVAASVERWLIVFSPHDQKGADSGLMPRIGPSTPIL